jgi:hypothetical protein
MVISSFHLSVWFNFASAAIVNCRFLSTAPVFRAHSAVHGLDLSPPIKRKNFRIDVQCSYIILVCIQGKLSGIWVKIYPLFMH